MTPRNLYGFIIYKIKADICAQKPILLIVMMLLLYKTYRLAKKLRGDCLK